jgi:hypothetical protein
VYWFALGCGPHSFIDILTRRNDGPLLFFPFNWTYRFPVPVSYWYPAYGGRTFAVLEGTLDVVIIAYFATLALTWARRRCGEKVTTPTC